MTTTSTANPLIQEIVRRIVKVSQPEKVILFGSRARGTVRADSDIDLPVIAHSTQPRHRRAAPLYGVLSDILTPMDIVVYSPEEVHEWSEVRQAFVTTAIREGRCCMKTQTVRLLDRLNHRGYTSHVVSR